MTPRSGEGGDTPSFSIVIPSFQRRDLVAEAVRAVQRIDYPGAVDLIVVVDGSTDGTAAALAEVSGPIPLQVIEQPNSGAAAARNRGAIAARGDVILFLDDDMICQGDILRHHARSYAGGADAVLGHIPLDPASPPSLLSRDVGLWAERRAEKLRGGAPLTLFDLLTGQISIRRSVFAELGGFDASFTRGGSFGNEDLDLGTRLLDRYKVSFNPDAVSYQRYVVTPRRQMRQWFEAGRADVAFARKHPLRARELFALHGLSRGRTRWLIRPLAAVPGLHRALAAMAAAAAERAGSGEGKGLARALFYFARDVVYWAGVRSAGGVPASSTALVLCYHAVADLSDDRILADYGIEPRQLAGQFDRLIRRGFSFVSAAELRACLAGQAGLPRKAVLLTFDDCYAELVQVARDILAPRGIPALAFAVTGMASNTNERDQAIGARRLDLLDGEGLRHLAAQGVEIGCHSRNHRAMPTLDEASLTDETQGAAADLERAGLPKPRAFAYPYGERDDRSERAVEAAGFAIAFGLRRARVTRRSNPFDIPRVEILARDRGRRFRLKTAFPRLAGAIR